MGCIKIIILLLLPFGLSGQLYYTPPAATEGLFYAGQFSLNTEGGFRINLWSDDVSGLWYQDTAKSWIDISCGDWYCIGLKTDSTLWFWGHDEAGVGGQGGATTTTTDRLRPIQIGTDTTWAKIAAGNSPGFGLAIKGDGTLWLI